MNIDKRKSIVKNEQTSRNTRRDNDNFRSQAHVSLTTIERDINYYAEIELNSRKLGYHDDACHRTIVLTYNYRKLCFVAERERQICKTPDISNFDTIVGRKNYYAQ